MTRRDAVYYPWVDRFYEPTGPDGEDTEGPATSERTDHVRIAAEYIIPTMHDDYLTPDLGDWRERIRPAILRQERPQL
jgi:hypothetical protein